MWTKPIYVIQQSTPTLGIIMHSQHNNSALLKSVLPRGQWCKWSVALAPFSLKNLWLNKLIFKALEWNREPIHWKWLNILVTFYMTWQMWDFCHRSLYVGFQFATLCFNDNARDLPSGLWSLRAVSISQRKTGKSHFSLRGVEPHIRHQYQLLEETVSVISVAQ